MPAHIGADLCYSRPLDLMTRPGFKASFSLSPTKLLPALAMGWKLGESYGLSAAATAAAAFGAGSTLEVKADYGLRAAKRPMSPYRYAFLAHKDLF